MQSGLHGILAPVGVGNYRYRPQLLGGRSRPASSKLAETVSILDFGGNLVGADNTAALNRAYAAILKRGGTGGTISFPAGKYRFNSSPTLTLPSGLFSLSIIGDGADSTVLYWPSTAGLTIACSSALHSAHVRNLSITTGTANVGSGLKLTNSVLLGVIQQSDVTGVTVRGDDGGAVSNYWNTGIEVIGLSMISFTDVLAYGAAANGIGVSVTGNAVTGPNFGIIYNFDRCTFLSLGIGIVYNTYIQGVQVSQSNFTNCQTGIHVPAAAVGITQLAITTSQFDCLGANIFVQSPIAGFQLTNSLFYINASGFGVVFTSTGFQCSITGNVFAGEPATASTTGVSLSGNITGSCCVGNTFYDVDVGIDLGGTATWLVHPNVFDTVTAPIANSGLNRVGPDFVVGTGGVVTQITNKTTTVTLNKRCGQITMEATQSIAAFGATGNITFTLSNTTISTTDVVIVNVDSGGTANAYAAHVVNVGAGACNIMVENKTAGAKAEAVVLNFAVIKAVNS